MCLGLKTKILDKDFIFFYFSNSENLNMVKKLITTIKFMKSLINFLKLDIDY